MLDETGTEPTRSDALSADESLSSDAADDPAAAAADEQAADKEVEQDRQGSDDAEAQARSTGGPEGRRVHQGRQGHHRSATALVGPAHRVLR